MIIDLPYPHKTLWPNGRGHWRAVHRETQKHRQWAQFATLEAMDHHAVAEGFVPTGITIRVHAKPTGPYPDKDNCIAACKAMLDGIADGLGVNDRDFPAPKVEFAKPREGRFVVELSRG